MLDIQFSSHSGKFLKKSEKEVIMRILSRIELLKDNPFPADSKRIINRREKLFRVRVGDYRILYSVIYSMNTLLIVDIDKRSRIYD